MSISCSARVVLRGLLVASVILGTSSSGLPVSRGQVPAIQNARMATFDHAGDTFFALSLVPEFSNSASASQRAAEVVVYVDTSASQVGKYKRESIDTLKRFLKNLNADDRVKICAVDLDPVPLTDGFVDPVGVEVQTALRTLENRTPLGATDFDLMLEAASTEFGSTEGKNRCVIYIGDGVTRSGTADVLTQHIKSLVKQQVSVSSYLLGTSRSADVLAVLANHTGGNVYIDNDDNGENERATQEGALFLSQTVHNPVFWSQSVELDKNVIAVFPSQILPLRADRDSILIGTTVSRDLIELEIRGLVNGTVETLKWSVKPEPSDIEFAFLPALLKRARIDQGATLPTVGSAGLREVKAILKVEAEQLATLGSQALVNGDQESAKKLADAAIVANPIDPRAGILAMTATYRVQDDDPFGAGNNDPFGNGNGDGAAAGSDGDGAGGQDEPQDDPFGSDPTDPSEDDPGAMIEETLVTPVQDPVDKGTQITDDPNRMILLGPGTQESSEKLLQEQYLQSDSSILSEEVRIQIVNERARKQVEYEQKRAREEMLVNPDAAIERLKNVIEILDQTTDLYPSTRQDLRYSLESALLSFRQRKLEFDDRRAREIELKAIADNQRVRAIRLQRDEEELAQLINRFSSLMRERNYDAAITVTETALEKAPQNPHIVAASEGARVARNVTRMQDLRKLKADKFYESLYLAEVATVPFPDTQWLVYPDAEEWRQKVLRRRKWQDIRLHGGPIDESILRTLEEPVDFDYEEIEWSEVRRDLFDRFNINIITDQTALDDGLAEEEPITLKLSGIRLKFALRELLKTKNATYIVKDEVLRVISMDNVEDPQFLVTNVYNVGDLVAPRQPIQMGGMGMMGGMGGGMGGMGGGMGGMGGGMGGMGGGMGGMFCVQEPTGALRLSGVVSSPVKETAVPDGLSDKPTKAVRIKMEGDYDSETAWNDYFSRNVAVNPANVRETVRQLMAENKSIEVVHLICAAIRNDQLQPWMYEAITLAMQIGGFPKNEIERAVMSAIDLSDDPNDVIYAAQYMAVNGMEQRSIRLLKDIAAASPTSTEPFLIGLRAAQRVNDMEGIKWATIGIFGQEWPDFPEIVREAKFAADGLRLSLKKQGLMAELEAFENALLEAQVRDCFIEVEWTGDADIDVYVAEPDGSICSRLNRRTSGGGIYLGDKYSSKVGASGRMREQYVLPKGFSGNYQLLVRRVWGEVTSNRVTVSVYQHYRSPREGSMTRQVPLDDIGAVVLFNLANGRRTDSLEDQTIQTVVRQQVAKNKFIFAQRMENYASDGSGSYGNGAGSGSGLGNGGVGGGVIGNPNGMPNGSLWGRSVGYQPIIQTIPEGTMLQIFHATTADRLHVIVSLSPMFPQVSSVSTFNIFGNADTAEGIAGGGGQGGGGGGLGGGGGGGGF